MTVRAMQMPNGVLLFADVLNKASGEISGEPLAPFYNKSDFSRFILYRYQRGKYKRTMAAYQFLSSFLRDRDSM